jgi:hypothetical protein
MRIHKPALSAVVVVLLAGCALTSCASDPLSTTCGDYIGKTEAEQLALAELWGEPVRGQSSKMTQMVAPSYRRDLLAYCPSHSGERLKDLQLTLRPS